MHAPCKGVNWTCEGLKLQFQLLWILRVFRCELNLWGIETKGEGVMEVDIDIIVIVKIIVILLLLIARYFRDLGSRWNCVWIEPVRDWNA